MELRSNIPEIIAKLERLKTAVGGESGGVPPIPDFSDAILSALNAGMGKMKFRIFNTGTDADGQSLGGYVGNKSTKGNLDGTGRYAKYRLSRGRQIGYKDLELEGSLRRSIETVKSDNKQVVIAVTNDETAKIARYQEQQVANIRAGFNGNKGNVTPVRIFTLSPEELEQVRQEGNEAIRQTVVKIFNEL